MIENEKEVIERYVAGEPVRQLAKSIGVAIQTVYSILARHGASTKNRNNEAKAAQLLRFHQNGTRIITAAKMLGMSASTATRIIRQRRADGTIIETKKGRPKKSELRRVTERRPPQPTPDEQQVAKIYNDICRAGFPYPLPLVPERVAYDLSQLKALKISLVDGEIHPRSPAGIKICAAFFPNRYEATSKNGPSAHDGWHTETILKKAIRFQLRHGDPVTPHRVLKAVTLLCRTPTIFRPAVARFVYERYCPKGGVTWDPCIGYGGRLLGACAAGIRYVGTDVDQATVDGNYRLATAVGFAPELHLVPAESFNPPAVDLVFTSPPYFNRERYSHGRDQSWRKYTNLEDWLSGFLFPVTGNAFNALRSKGYLVFNIADLKERGSTIPIVARTVEGAIAMGFVHSETLKMPLAAINKRAPTEPILVFQKP